MECLCGCGGSVCDAVMVDIPIPCSISNWGAYGIAACMAAILQRPDLVQDAKTHLRILRECVDHGGVDGLSMLPEPSEDAMPEEVHVSLLELLRSVASAANSPLTFFVREPEEVEVKEWGHATP
jgi:hypothetical protein